MRRKKNPKQHLLQLLHKISRFSKHQKVFVIYLVVLIIFVLFTPVIRIEPIDAVDSRLILLFSSPFFKTMVIILISLLMLALRNMSFKFRNIIIAYFGFKENESLFNFGLLWIITTAYISIADTLHVAREVTTTIHVTGGYYFVQLLLLAGLILTLVSVVRKAQKTSKSKIINIVDDKGKPSSKDGDTLKGLFGGK